MLSVHFEFPFILDQVGEASTRRSFEKRCLAGWFRRYENYGEPPLLKKLTGKMQALCNFQTYPGELSRILAHMEFLIACRALKR